MRSGKQRGVRRSDSVPEDSDGENSSQDERTPPPQQQQHQEQQQQQQTKVVSSRGSTPGQQEQKNSENVKTQAGHATKALGYLTYTKAAS